MKNTLFEHPDLDKLIPVKDYSGAVKLLLEEQKKSWAVLAKNYDLLDSAKVKTFQFPGFVIKVQNNPGELNLHQPKLMKNL